MSARLNQLSPRGSDAMEYLNGGVSVAGSGSYQGAGYANTNVQVPPSKPTSLSDLLSNAACAAMQAGGLEMRVGRILEMLHPSPSVLTTGGTGGNQKEAPRASLPVVNEHLMSVCQTQERIGDLLSRLEALLS